MNIIKNLVAAVTALGLFAAAQAVADEVDGGDLSTIDCGDSVTAEILGVLLAAGNIDAVHYAALCARVTGEQTEMPPAAAAASSPEADAPEVSGSEADPTWDFKWSNTFKLSRSDDAFKLAFGGRIMVDGNFAWLSDGLENDFLAAGIDPREGSGVEFRRARIYFSGDVYDRVFFKMQYDFAQPEDDDNPDFKDVFLGLKKLGPVGSVQVGHFKEPMFLNEWTSSKYITFMERGLNNVFFPGRNVGFMAMGDAAEKTLFWQAGIFRNTNDQGSAFDDWGDEEWHVATRLSAAPIHSEGGTRVLHLGAGYIHRFLEATPTNLRFRERPESHLAQRFVDTGGFRATDADILNLELATVYGPFSFQTEYTNTWTQGSAGQDDLHFWGIYTFASYFLTGESRNYEFGHGRFGRVKPRANFNPMQGDWGAWELAVRYSYLDLTDRNVRGGNLWDITVGINWYLFPNLRMMLNYVHGDVSDRVTSGQEISGVGNLVQTRFQLDF